MGWIVLIFVFLVLANIAREGIINLIGLHIIPLFAISVFFFLGSGLLLAKGIQAKKTNKIQPAKISFFIKAGFITLLLTAIFLLATVFQTKDLSNKYEQAIDLLVSAMDNYSKNNFSASVDSTEKAIALLEDCQSLNTSATLLFQAKELLKRPDNKNIIDKRIVDKRIAENNERIAENNERHGKDSTLAYLIAQDFIKKTLKSPSTAVFPGKWHEGVYVGHIGNYTYAIRAYVDSQNSFGATLRTYYYAEVRYDGDADSWFLEDISFN